MGLTNDISLDIDSLMNNFINLYNNYLDSYSVIPKWKEHHY